MKNIQRISILIIALSILIGMQPVGFSRANAAETGKNTVKIFIGSPTYARHHMAITAGQMSDEFRFEVKGFTVKSSSYASSNTACLKIMNTAQGKCKVQALKEGTAYVVLTLQTKEGQILTERVFISICTRYTDCMGIITQTAGVYKGAHTNADVENQDYKGNLPKDAKVTVLSTCGEYYVIQRRDGGVFEDDMDSGFTAKTNIRIPVTQVRLDKTAVQMETGGSGKLTVTVFPELADDKQVTWESRDESVVCVTQSGELTGKKAGNAVVRVRTTDGGYTADCQVTVTLPKNSQQWDATGQQPATQTPKPTKAPDIRVKALDHKRIQISWDKKAGAKSYEIRRSTKKNGKYKTIGSVSKKKRKYIDKTPKYRKKYYYQVRAKKKNKKVAYTAKAWGRTAKKNIKKTNLDYFKKHYSEVCRNAKQDMNAYCKTIRYLGGKTESDYMPVKYKMTGKELEIHVYLEFVRYTEKKDSSGKKSYSRESVYNKQEKMTYTNSDGKKVTSKSSYVQLFLDGIQAGYHNIKINGNSKDFPYLEFKTKLVPHVKNRDKGMHKNQRYIEVLIGGECPNCDYGKKGNHWYHAGPNNNTAKDIVYEDTNLIYMPLNTQLVSNKEEGYSYEKNENDYRTTAAHELGHIFGLADAYYDEDLGGDRCDENEETCIKFGKRYDNLMIRHDRVTKILSNDLEMMLQAYQHECRATWTFMQYYKSYSYKEKGNKYQFSRSQWIKTNKDKVKQ